MSRQQVNLYQRPPKSHSLQLNTASMGLGVLAFAVILLVLSLLKVSERSELEQQLQTLQTQQDKLSEQVDSLRDNLPSDRTNQLEHERQELEQKLQNLKQVRSLVAQQGKDEEQGFAAQLSGLASRHLKGISLREIRLLNGGTYIELAGDARPAEAVPQYLQQLRVERPFQASKFGPLNLQRDEKRHNVLNFRLGGEPEEATP